MPKISKEDVNSRKEQIVNACNELYKTMSFKEITIKEIGNHIPFTRTTIYNYFQTKEEIFLALFKREYDRWNEELRSVADDNEALSKKEIADKIAASLQKRKQLLRLLSMNNYEMEANSRPELLTDFKLSYGASLRLFARIPEKYCPDMSARDIQDLVYMFFPFMFGIYPYTAVTEKQRKAMKEANIDYKYQTVYEIVYTYLLKLLGGK